MTTPQQAWETAATELLTTAKALAASRTPQITLETIRAWSEVLPRVTPYGPDTMSDDWWEQLWREVAKQWATRSPEGQFAEPRAMRPHITAVFDQLRRSSPEAIDHFRQLDEAKRKRLEAITTAKAIPNIAEPGKVRQLEAPQKRAETPLRDDETPKPLQVLMQGVIAPQNPKN